MDVLSDNEVRTLPPLASGGLINPPAGHAPVSRYISGLPSDPHETGTFLRHGVSPSRFIKGEMLAADQKKERAERKERLKGTLGSNLGDPPRLQPMDEAAANAVLFQDANLYSMLQSKVLDRGADLTPALLQGPSLLSRFMDPNAEERRVMLAKGLVSRKEDRLGLKRARQVSSLRQLTAVGPVTVDVASLKLDTAMLGAILKTTTGGGKHNKSRGRLMPPRKGRGGGGGGVVNLNAVSTLEQRNDFPPSKDGQNRQQGGAGGDDGGEEHEQGEAGGELLLEEGDERTVFEILRQSLNRQQQQQLQTFGVGGGGASGNPAIGLEEEHALEQQRHSHSKGATASSLDPEMAQLDTDIGRVRAYLELLAQYSQSHFLVYRGRTLTTTPDFLSFQRRHASQWPAVSGAILQLEALLVRYAVPLAVVEGEQLAAAAYGAVRAKVSVPDLLQCLENLEQVEPLLQLPGKQAPVGDTQRDVRKNGAVRIQSLVRRFLERGRFLDRLQQEHAAGLLQRQTRGRLVWSRTMAVLDNVRVVNKAVGVGLQVRLAEQWRKAGGRPPAGRVEVHLPSMSVDEALRLRLGAAQEAEAAQASATANATTQQAELTNNTPAAAVGSHKAPLGGLAAAAAASASAAVAATAGLLRGGAGSGAAPAGSWGRFPSCQNHDALQRLSSLRDPGLAHLVYVSPVELPEDVLQYWASLVEQAAKAPPGSVRERFTVVVPEMAAHFAAHYPLASQLRHSPLALRRIQRLVSRHAVVDTAAAAVKKLVRPLPQHTRRPSSANGGFEVGSTNLPLTSTTTAQTPVYTVGDPAAAAGGSGHAAFGTRGARAYVVPGCSSMHDDVVAMALGLPVLSPQPKQAVRLRSRSGGKVAFTEAGINVPIGAHDIRSQEDLAIALAKLIAVNLDVEEWSLRADADLGAVGVAYIKTSDLACVNGLREDRHTVITGGGVGGSDATNSKKKDSSSSGSSSGSGSHTPNGKNRDSHHAHHHHHTHHHGHAPPLDPSAWLHPDVQLLARATLLKDLRTVLPQKVTFAAPQLYPGGWADYLKHFVRGGGVVEAEPPKASLVGRVCVNLLLGPHACSSFLATTAAAKKEKERRKRNSNSSSSSSNNNDNSASPDDGGGEIKASPPSLLSTIHSAAHLDDDEPPPLTPKMKELDDDNDDTTPAAPLPLPVGGVVVESMQELLVTPHRLPLACSFPQRCLPPEALEACALALGKTLLEQGVCGFVSASFAVFRDKKSLGGKLRLWGESIEPWLTPAAAAHACCSMAVSSPTPNHPLPPNGSKGKRGGGGLVGDGVDDDPFEPSERAAANAAAEAARIAAAKAKEDAEKAATADRRAVAETKRRSLLTPMALKAELINDAMKEAAAVVAKEEEEDRQEERKRVASEKIEQGPIASSYAAFAAAFAAEAEAKAVAKAAAATAVMSATAMSATVGHHQAVEAVAMPPPQSQPRPWITTAAAAGFGQGARSTPSGMAYVATVGAMRHPGLARLHPTPSLLRLLRLQGHSFDLRTKQGDLVWPVDSLCGGVAACASVSRHADEEAASHAFLKLLKNFFHRHVGTRTLAGTAAAKQAGAWQPVGAQRQSRGNVDPDGLGDFVALTDLAEATAARFHLRRNPPAVVEEPKYVSRFGASGGGGVGGKKTTPGASSVAGSSHSTPRSAGKPGRRGKNAKKR